MGDYRVTYCFFASCDVGITLYRSVVGALGGGHALLKCIRLKCVHKFSVFLGLVSSYTGGREL